MQAAHIQGIADVMGMQAALRLDCMEELGISVRAWVS